MLSICCFLIIVFAYAYDPVAQKFPAFIIIKMFLFVFWDFLVFFLSLTFSFQMQVCQYLSSSCSDMLIDLLLKVSTSQLILTENYITVSAHLNTFIHKHFFGLHRCFCPELAFFIIVTSFGTFWPQKFVHWSLLLFVTFCWCISHV